ncbi:MAG: hypothetical protein KatS3mg031_2696 [Chitinophagales bacterium]|nr:MAG: hypothetical protein KatS3mg031_2696 [Chitinophagales bacterium]
MLKRKWESLYRFPSNLKLFVIALLASNLAVSNFHCNENHPEPVCPVEYKIEKDQQYTLTGKWKFVGFESLETRSMEYPPCGDNETFIIFSDSMPAREGAAFRYPYLFQGRTLINSFVGTYVADSSNTIKLSETIKSRVNGTEPIERFQQKFHRALESTERYYITDNLLQLVYDKGSRNLLFVAQNDTILF